ncbi:MAG: radical SAM protein [Anaerolineae bacterium]|nr:radical SAM protein [Anaerolineae bacterium]
MQHPAWPTIGQRLRAAGLHVMLLTNGLLLKKQAAHLSDSVDEVIVSLDGGTPATYQHIRGVDAFNLVLEGIAAAHAAGLPVTTRTTVQRANFRELPQIIRAAQGAGADVVSFLPIDVSSDFAFGARADLLPMQGQQALTAAEVDAFEAILQAMEGDFAADFASGRLAEPPQKLRRLALYFRSLLDDSPYPPPRCNAPHFSAVLEVDGRLRPCYFLPEWGALGQQSLAEALNQPEAVALRRAYRTGQRPECARCVCPLYKGPRALLRP